jgi:Fur family zinc uptake transcriptional regulator
MTAVRRAILELLLDSDEPLGAYALRERLQERLGREIAPPTVYRSLEFLLEHRLIARIESRNAYVPCAHPERSHSCVFFVCNQCSTSVEIENPQMEALMEKDAESLGFRVARRFIEFQGLCSTCSSEVSRAGQAGSEQEDTTEI